MSLPNLSVFNVTDSINSYYLAKHTSLKSGPKYFRIEKGTVPELYDQTYDLEKGMGLFNDNTKNEMLLISTGYISHMVKEIADNLSNNLNKVSFLDIFKMKPFDESLFVKLIENKKKPLMNKLRTSLIFLGVVVAVFLWFASSLDQKVPAGYVAVATLFGEVQKDPYEEGLHIPVNPFYEWYFYDVRQKSHLEEANVPSQDQLQTKIQVSVQFRLINESAPKILQETGQSSDVLRVHIVPKLRSLLREQGKAIKRAEDFFSEKTQQNMQISLLEGLTDYLGPKGVKVSAVLIMDISLTHFILSTTPLK